VELIGNHIFLLLLITLLGTALGKLQLGSFSLGSSGIIFVALGFGHFGYTLPADFQTLGLVLFVYSIGLQAGPGFFYTLLSRGLKLALLALGTIGVAFAATLGFSLLFGFGADTGAGLFAGALSSTPGLAVAVEMTGGGQAAAAYGLTYFFGVTGVILFIQLLPRAMGVNVAEEERQLAEETARSNPAFTFHHLEVTNPNLFNRSVRDIRLQEIAPVVITRLLRRGAAEPILVGGDTVLMEGDHLRIAGREPELMKAELFLGRPIAGEIEFERVLTKRDIVVSKRGVAGMTLAQLNIREVFNAHITRISRGGIDIPASPGLRLHMGDKVHVVGDGKSLENVVKVFGNDIKATYSVNPLPIFAGLLLGFLLGKVPLYIPWGGTFTLGTTGGVLLAGLILSGLYKTGPIIWEIPASANSFIRELGLVLFLATVGTRTGATLVHTVQTTGISLLLAGLVVTTLPMLTTALLCRKVLRMPLLRTLGLITGAMTSTPGLAAASEFSDSHHIPATYATVYPVALIGMILYTKLLVLLLP